MLISRKFQFRFSIGVLTAVKKILYKLCGKTLILTSYIPKYEYILIFLKIVDSRGSMEQVYADIREICAIYGTHSVYKGFCLSNSILVYKGMVF